MKMSCKDIEKNAVDFFDNKLTDENLVQFENHLKTCTSCSAMVEAHKKWLSQHRFELKYQGDLANEDLIRLKRSIMDSVRSSQQAERAAGYISSYQSRLPVDQEIEQIAEPDDKQKRRIVSAWFRPRMLVGYAAMLILLVVAGFLVKTIIGSESASRAVLQGDGMVTMPASDMGGIFGNDSELPEIDSAAGVDSDKNIYEETNVEEAAPESADEDGNTQTPSLGNTWQVFNGKLTDLAIISPIFEKRETTQSATETYSADPEMETSAETTSVDAVTTVDLLSTAKAIRILTKQSEPEQNTVDVQTTRESVADSLINVTEILILAAWNNAEIDEQLANLDSMLESSQTPHSLQLIDDRIMYESIEKMIGIEQYSFWMKQIEEQNLESYSWISIKIGG